MMQRLLITAAAAAIVAAPLVQAGKIYRWLDADGNLHFGDRPPSRESAEAVTLKPINTYTDTPLIETRTDTMAAHGKTPRITLYSTRSCGHCRRAKAYMQNKGIAFTELDIERSPKARKQFDRLGGRGVPLITAGEVQMTGFSPKSFEQLLKRARGG